MIAMVPCGECRELVDAVHGCRHWRPVRARADERALYRDRAPLSTAERTRRYRERRKQGLVGAAKMGQPPLTEHEKAVRGVQRAAALERRARESGEAARREREARELAEFRRMMLIREVG